MASAFSGARRNRLDLSIGIALGSASQIALFVAPVLVLLSYGIGPQPIHSSALAGRGGHDPDRDVDRCADCKWRQVGLVRRRAAADGIFRLCDSVVSAAAEDLATTDGTRVLGHGLNHCLSACFRVYDVVRIPF